MGTGGSFPGRPGRKADRSPPLSAQVKNMWSTSPLHRTSSCRGALLSNTYSWIDIYLSSVTTLPFRCNFIGLF